VLPQTGISKDLSFLMDGGGFVKKIIRNLKTRLYGIILLYAINRLMIQMPGAPHAPEVH
jgi:hypothetical protein